VTAVLDRMLPTRRRPTAWQADAACHGRADVMFQDRYVHDRDDGKRHHYRNGCAMCAALALCGRCPVRRACLDYALEAEGGTVVVRDGVWGGATPNRRQAIYRRRNRNRTTP